MPNNYHAVRNASFEERRMHKRKTCSLHVGLDSSRYACTGHLKDLSLGGAYVEVEPEFEPSPGDRLVMVIPTSNRKKYVKLNAEIIRVNPSGIGIRFLKTDPH